MKLKIVFMGTPNFAVPILEALIKEYNVVLVVSQPDKEYSRKKELLPTKTKMVAIKHNIDVFQPVKIKDEYQKILEYEPDMIITCAYGQIIPKELLDYPKYGAINVHGSLLPKLRGGAPIHRALINGDDETGVTIMYMSYKMDAGDVISQRKISIEDTDNVDTLFTKLSYLGRDLLMETIPLIINNKNLRIKQNEEEVTYGLNIKKEEEIIDFNDTKINIFNKIRGLSSIPGAYTYLNGKILKIYSASILDKEYKGKNGQIVDVTRDGLVVKVKDGSLLITDIKIEGKGRVLVKDYLNGIKDKTSLLNIVLGDKNE